MDAAPSAQPVEPPILEQLKSLVDRAKAGDATATPELRATLERHPEVWQYAGDLSAMVEHAWTQSLAADYALASESIRLTIDEMKKDLAGEHPTRLERMLVDQVISCWLELKHAEHTHASVERSSLDRAAFALKRLESGQKRYLDAVKTLTAIRKLMPNALAPAASVKLHDPDRKLA